MSKLSKSKRNRFSQIIPTFNEQDNIREVVERVESIRSKLPFDLTIVIVDDNSRDSTAEVVKEMVRKYDNLILLQRPRSSGLGSAYLDGFVFSLAFSNAGFLGEMDADLQHPPETLVSMCEVASRGSDVVLASRYIPGGSSSGLTFTRKMISKGANVLAKIFLRLPVRDTTTGFRVLSSKAVSGMMSFNVSSKGYAFQVESLYAYKKLNMSFSEVPLSFEMRKSGKTKLDWKEIFRFAAVTIRTGIVGLKKTSS